MNPLRSVLICFILVGSSCATELPLPSSSSPAALAPVWRSRADCLAVRASANGDAPGAKEVRTLRLSASSFVSPDTAGGLDAPWLTCVIAWSRADLVLVDDLPGDEATASAFVDSVADLLSKDRQLSWYARRSAGCPGAPRVALLYPNDNWVTEVQVGSFEVVPLTGATTCSEVDPAAFLVRLTWNGLPFSLVTARLRAQEAPVPFATRRQAMAALVAALESEPWERLVIVLGNFETVGDEASHISETTETEILAEELANGHFARLAGDLACSRYDGARALLVDHVAARGAAFGVHVDGACRATACASLEAPSSAPAFAGACPTWIDFL